MNPVSKFNEMIMKKIKDLIVNNQSQEKIVSDLQEFADCFMIDWRNGDKYDADSIEYQISHAIGVNQMMLLRKRRHDAGIRNIIFSDTFFQTVAQKDYCEDTKINKLSLKFIGNQTISLKVQK